MKSLITTKIFVSLLLLFTSNLLAKPNLKAPIADFMKAQEIAGEAGPFTSKENMPKDYFLIPKNLPFLVGLSLYNPSSSNLELTQVQIDNLVTFRNGNFPRLVKMAKKIKTLEMQLVDEIGLKYNSKDAALLFPIVDEIAKLRTEMTKAHLKCIQKVKSILTEAQYEELLDYGVVNMF
ncbi:hypothetical protein N9A28_00260 [Sulfurimonas sp.]|nr:hypothetical protein [Sulfurimonas sp.]